MKRFVVCGETLIDLVQAAERLGVNFSSTWLALSAGGPMNSAVALGRLGRDSHFLGRFSRDSFGRQLRRYIREAGVQLDLATESSQSTSIAVVSLDDQGVASYTFHFAETANFGWQPEDLPALIQGGLPAHRFSVGDREPGRRGAAGLGGQLTGGDVVRHQRPADRDHRSRRVLGAGQAMAADGRACITASSRPATRTSSSWPSSRKWCAPSGRSDPVEIAAALGGVVRRWGWR